MLYSQRVPMAIRAALFLALQPPGRLTTIREIADGTGLPAPYLAKILRYLVLAGLVRSFRGPGGGMELGQAPESITLWSLVRATDHRPRMEWCVVEMRTCSAENPCPLHPNWSPLRERIHHLLEETTLASLVERAGDIESLSQGLWEWRRARRGSESFAARDKRRRIAQ